MGLQTYKNFFKLYEMPYIDYGNNNIFDLETEQFKNPHELLVLIFKILSGKRIEDKYGDVIQLKNNLEKQNFLKHLKNNPVLQAYIKYKLSKKDKDELNKIMTEQDKKLKLYKRFFEVDKLPDYLDKKNSLYWDFKKYNLSDFLEGKYIIAYHGSTNLFKKFSMSKNKSELNKNYYGDGIFFTPSYNVADKYASANRNIGISSDIIKELKSKNREAGEFLEDLYKYGDKAWTLPKYKNEDGTTKLHSNFLNGVDPNDLLDLAENIISSKVKPIQSSNDFINIFDTSTGMPYYIFDLIKELDLNLKKYAPKVYTVEIRANNVLVTNKKSEAKSAKQKGYDGIIYYGNDLVNNIPEINILNENNIKIKKVEVVL